MSTRSVVLANIEQVAAEHEKTLPPLGDDLPLLESGLDSLCFAVLVARLEGELDVDPFTATETVAFPVTIGDLIKLYEDATVVGAA
jgi:acyl carrier protein